MGLLDSLWNATLPGLGGTQTSTCTALVPASNHMPVPAAAGGAGGPPATGFDTGTGYDGFAHPQAPRPAEPVLGTRGPLYWVDERHDDDWFAYDGYGRRVYHIGKRRELDFNERSRRRPKALGTYVLHWYPSGTVWDETHECMGVHFRSADDAKATAQEDHIGRSGGKGYRS
jgi:hypothetical protein